MPLNENVLRRGADPPKNVSGSTGTDSSVEFRKNLVKSGSDSCSTVTNFSSSGPRISQMKILDMRSRHSSAAMMFSTPFLSTTEDGYGRYTVIGKGGQISSNPLTGVVLLQRSRKFRRRGEPKTTCRHRRHTCVSGFHLHVKLKLRGFKGSSL